MRWNACFSGLGVRSKRTYKGLLYGLWWSLVSSRAAGKSVSESSGLKYIRISAVVHAYFKDSFSIISMLEVSSKC
jgi:hypothetical protein